MDTTIVMFNSRWPVPGLRVSMERNTTAGIGRRKQVTAVKRPRRDITEDRRDTCSHRSTEMSVMINKLKAIEYVALASPVVLMARKSPGCFITNVGFVRYSKLVATMNGWAMSPVQRSVTTIPLRRTWNGDLWKERFHIAAKTNELPATAIGDNIAIMIVLGRIAAWA